MQTIKSIVGMRQEGKSVELMMEYITSYIMGYNKVMNIVPVFISVGDVPEDRFMKLLELVVEADDDMDAESIILYNNPHVHTNVKNIDELLKFMEETLVSSECCFFIDDFDKILPSTYRFDTYKELNKFLDNYPNTTCSNSCDIVYTRTRGDEEFKPFYHADNNGETIMAYKLDDIVKEITAKGLPTSTKVYLRPRPGEDIQVPNPFGLDFK